MNNIWNLSKEIVSYILGEKVLRDSTISGKIIGSVYEIINEHQQNNSAPQKQNEKIYLEGLDECDFKKDCKYFKDTGRCGYDLYVKNTGRTKDKFYESCEHRKNNL